MAESVKQEKKNLMEDMPVDKKASMSMKPGMFQMKKGPFEMKPGTSKRGPLDKQLKGNQHKLPDHLKKAIEAAPEMKYPINMSKDPIKMGKDPIKMDKDPMSMKNPPLKAYGRKPLKMKDPIKMDNYKK